MFPVKTPFRICVCEPARSVFNRIEFLVASSVCLLPLSYSSVHIAVLAEPFLRARDLSQDLFHNLMTGLGRGANVQLLLGHALGCRVVVIMALISTMLVDDQYCNRTKFNQGANSAMALSTMFEKTCSADCQM